jgi:hypothetical protein
LLEDVKVGAVGGDHLHAAVVSLRSGEAASGFGLEA